MSFEFFQLLAIERTKSIDLTLLVPMFVSCCHALTPPVYPAYLLDFGRQTAFWSSLFPEAPPAEWQSRFGSSHQSKPTPKPYAVYPEDLPARYSSPFELRTQRPKIRRFRWIPPGPGHLSGRSFFPFDGWSVSYRSPCCAQY